MRQCCSAVLIASCLPGAVQALMVPGDAAQEAPAAGEGAFRDTAVADHDDIRGVRMGAGERSYLVRDRRIDVLKNVHGGVQARRASSPCPAPGLAEHHIKLALLKDGAFL